MNPLKSRNTCSGTEGDSSLPKIAEGSNSEMLLIKDQGIILNVMPISLPEICVAWGPHDVPLHQPR